MKCTDSNCKSRGSWVIWRELKPKGSTIDKMVGDYRKKFLIPTEQWLYSLKTFTDFICGEANKEENPSNKKFCKNTHQFRMPYSTIIAARKALIDAELDRLNHFRDILVKVTLVAHNINYFGHLATYDFTQRYCDSRGISPDAVYLHAGVVDGVNALIKAGYKIKKQKDSVAGHFVDLPSLPTPIADLGTLHAENFLCIYKHLIANLKNKTND